MLPHETDPPHPVTYINEMPFDTGRDVYIGIRVDPFTDKHGAHPGLTFWVKNPHWESDADECGVWWDATDDGWYGADGKPLGEEAEGEADYYMGTVIDRRGLAGE